MKSNPPMSHPDQYPIFDMWYKATDWILDKCEKMPRSVRFSLSQRIVQLSLDILEKIVEAIYTKDRVHLLKSINLNLEKLRLLFRLCKDRKYLSIAQYEYIGKTVNSTGKMCGGWLKKCEE